MTEKIINLLISAWLFVMCVDLLYLYYNGAWYDPIQWVETTEVILLFVIGVFSLGYFAIQANRFISGR